jgi:hypothetical protein
MKNCVDRRFQEARSLGAGDCYTDLNGGALRSPGMDGWIDAAKRITR